MSKPTSFIPYGRQSISDEDIESVVEVLKSPFLTQGPVIPKFEEALAKYSGAKYCVVVNSATSALHMACMAIGLSSEDVLLTTPISFAASANCALYCGAQVEFADIDLNTANLSVSSLENEITTQVKAVVPVHMAGQSCDMKAIHALVAEKQKKFGKKIFIIEDAAHALGGMQESNRVGSCVYSDMCVVSFHPVKSITTGEGGAVFTNSKELYEKLSELRSHGITKSTEKFVKESPGPWYYEQQSLGYNYRMTDFQAALGLSQLKRLDQFVARRSLLAKRYDEAFRNYPHIQLLEQKSFQKSAHHLYVIKIDFKKLDISKSELMSKLGSQGIGVQVHYIPIYHHPYYAKMDSYSALKFPGSERYYFEALSIPLYPDLTNDEQDYVISSLKI